MEPVPAENVNYVDPLTKLQVRSIQPELKHGKRTSALTEIKDPTGKTLWTVQIFTGRREIHLSPDGRFLVLTGCAL